MVRLGLYDTNNSNNNKGEENKDKKQNFSLAFYTNEASISPYTLGIDNHGTDSQHNAKETTICIKEEEKGPGEEKEEGEKTSSGEGVQDNLSQVWRHFLAETSLHGCKNVKERQFVKRVLWCCCILVMTGVLSWALMKSYLRYQEHPFVSVWGFQRQSTVPVPGLTICIPAKYNTEKLETARPAYRLIAYDQRGLPVYQGGPSGLEGFEKYMERWEKELDNITMKQVRRDIGFTKQDIFYFSSVYSTSGYKRHELVDVIGDLDVAEKSCWTVNWHLLDTSESEDTIAIPSEAEENSTVGDQGSVDSATEEPLALVDSDSQNNQNRSLTRGGNSTDQDNLDLNINLKSPTLDDIISNLLLSTAPPASNPQFSRADSTNATTTEPPGNKGKVGQAEPEDDDIPTFNRGEDAKILRLSLVDSIIFVMNLQQYNWLSTLYFAGVELYFHDLAAAYWSVNPILVRPGTMTTIYYKPTKYKFLPLPYKSFGGFESRAVSHNSSNTGCTDIKSPSFKNPMISLPPALYSGEMCMMEIAVNRSTQMCGCSTDKFFSRLHGVPECSVIDYGWCYSPMFREEYFKLLAASSDGTSEEQPCPHACTMTEIETTVSAADYPPIESHQMVALGLGMKREDVEKNFLMIAIKPQGPLMTTVEHVPELTLLNIIGSVGGWMGLCLGASLLTLTELFEAIIMSMWILYRKLVHRLRAQR